MTKYREILRLRSQGLSQNDIDARQLAVACKPPIFVIKSKIPEVGYNFRDSHRKHGMTV